MIQSLTLGPLPTDVQQQHERWGGWRWKQQLEGATVGIAHRAAQRILQHTACQQEHDAKCTGTRTGGTARTSDPTRVLTHFFSPDLYYGIGNAAWVALCVHLIRNCFA